ncbi:MAG: 23S rRNA (uracil(1939)-C(5))-methyltransferase RlmD [Gammaproteobacteria bacterium]|nr:23S rRNA (uracil(1939)-C(5))-methyltransferase RlmD [Gammaproteobacteria bacterium]
MNETSPVVVIEKMVAGGLGLAHLDSGKSVLVSDVLLDERVQLRLLSEKKNHVIAEPEQIVQAAAQRVKPECRYEARCGGCNLQHAAYPAQLRVKQQMVSDALQRVAGLPAEVAEAMPLPIESETAFFYRQRIRLHASKNGFGYRMKKSQRVVPIKRCLLAAEPLNEVLMQVVSDYPWQAKRGLCDAISLQLNPESSGVKLMLYCDLDFLRLELKAFARWAVQHDGVEAVFAEVKNRGVFTADGKRAEGSEALLLSAHIDGRRVSWETGRFFQVNLPQNQTMLDYVKQHLELDKTSRVLDLYCGVGNFSLPLAERCHELLGIDSQGGAMRMARLNAKEAGLENCRFQKGDAGLLAEKLVEKGEKFSHLVIDPPRQGAAALLPSIKALGIEQMAYVSCDPVTLARDLKQLLAQGWVLEKLQTFDLFPQTHHIESVAILQRVK